MTLPLVTLDREADMLYVALADGDVHETRAFGDLRMVDYSAEGEVLGVEFVSASHGVDVTGLPMRAKVEPAIGASGFQVPIFA